MKKILRFIKDRTTTQYHKQWTGFEPGYRDPRQRLLHTPFQILCDYIELECAYQSDWGEGETWWRKLPVIRFWIDPQRRPFKGLEYLKFYIEGDDEHWAEFAKECLFIYLWWKYARPHRDEPMDLSGWSEFDDRMEEKYGSMLDNLEPNCNEEGKITSYTYVDRKTEEEQEQQRKLFNKLTEIEKQYNDEDEEMLCRLMKIRLYMWI
jgi:hypothetical protein